jgi:hypothetical protein
MIGIFRPKEGVSRIFSKNNGRWVILTLFLAFFLQGESGAETIEPAPQWFNGSSWDVRAIYRQLSGVWSDPILWTFTVVSEEEGSVQIRVKSEESPGRALLSFNKESGQLRHIRVTDFFRGKAMVREVQIDTLSPVYPFFTAIPFHIPFFLYSSPSEDYRLERLLNGQPIGSEILHQTIEPVTQSQFTADLPEEAKKEWETYSFDSDGVLFLVQKKAQLLFRQVWFKEFPWALYTESKDCRAWLRREGR